MNVYEEYQKKLTTPQQAVQCIQSGDWVDYGVCAGHPVALDRALAQRGAELHDVKIRGMNALWLPEIAKIPDAAQHFCWNSWAMMGDERKMQKLGMCYYAPLRYSELPRFYRENLEPNAVAMFRVTPMDEHGNFNFGPSCSHMAAVVENSRRVIVEVNPNLPRCLGGHEECVNIRDVDFIVEDDSPMVELLAKPSTAVDEAVAAHVVSHLRGGECLQLGIGAMPNAVGTLIAQSDLKDFGVNSEMYVDAFVDMSLAGKITGKYKNIDKGRQVYSFAAGSQRVYDFLNDNRECMTAPIDYVNDIRTIAAIDNFASICGAVEVDLYGQVSAESSGFRQISGAGGQQDFVLGAYLSRGGKSFICCSSTYVDKNGTSHSRIVPSLAQALAGEHGDAALRRDVLDHRARRGDRAAGGDRGDDVALALAVLGHAGGVDADEALAAPRAVGPFEEVHLPADAGELAGARAVRDLLDHELGDGNVRLTRRTVGAHRQQLMHTLDHIVRLGEVDTVRTVHALQARVVLIDLEDDRAGTLKNRAPGVIRNAKAAVTVLIRPRDGDKGHAAADVLIAVEIRQRAQHDGQELHQPARLQLALIVADVPAIVGKALLLGVALDDLDARADDKPAAHLDVPDLSLARGERVVEQLGKAHAEAVVHPVAAPHRLHGGLRRDELRQVILSLCIHFLHADVYAFLQAAITSISALAPLGSSLTAMQVRAGNGSEMNSLYTALTDSKSAMSVRKTVVLRMCAASLPPACRISITLFNATRICSAALSGRVAVTPAG